MPKADQYKSELIDKAAAIATGKLPEARREAAARFVRLFWRNVPPDDMLAHSADDLYSIALGLLQFAGDRRPGEARIRVFNPSFEQNGWQSSHTVVEIVNDDMPFLVDSVTAALNDLTHTVHLVIHPILKVRRDEKGRLADIVDPEASDGDGGAAESFMHILIDEITEDALLQRIETTVAGVLSDVRAAVVDWRAMRATVGRICEEVAGAPVGEDEREETASFLKWLDDDHFTYLGYRHYRFVDRKGRTDLEIDADSGLGILKSPDVSVFEGARRYASLPEEVQTFMRQPRLLIVMKANRRSTVHRPVHLDTIIVKTFDEKGRVAGEHLIIGLFTSIAYNRSARDIPFLRRKVERTLSRAGFDPRSHDGKALTHILDTFPRDELFQISDDDLLDMSIGILHLQERQRVALFVRRDAYDRFVSCLVYVPRDRYNTDLRLRFQRILEKSFSGSTTAFYTQLSEGALARVHYLIRTQPGQIPEVSATEIEAQLVDAARTWPDLLQEVLVAAKGEERGLDLMRRFADAFPAGYREATPAAAAVGDIDRIVDVLAGDPIGLNLYRQIEQPETHARFKLYHRGRPVALSDVLPMLENMGLRVIAEVPTAVRPAGAEPIWIHDFEIESRGGKPIDVKGSRTSFHEAFARIWSGEVEDDGFNHLVLAAGLGWRDVILLRAYGKYLRQARFAFSQDTIEDTLARHPAIVTLIVKLFHARFDPERNGDRALAERGLKVEIEHALDAVSNLDEDRILRRYVNLVTASLRTNHFQPGADGKPKPCLSIKLDSGAVEELPLPRPWREIFVYSPRVEAVHLRGGKVARGGIRWSDRREDFRTEILGLMKAQMVKNAVIVPVGSKGGFVVKRPPADGGREAFQAEGVECYRTMMRGLLDITDNIVAGTIVPPANVVRHDEDDPYLVVAADKGTATFSDIANGISQDYGFWLDDAFASGGSAGYDHKKMGITAKGAWESVKRHFRELGRNIQEEPFTVVGVGDMSGDVFGNGMLLSRQTRLLAAFNHLHIFLDPDPDTEQSWLERKRLFDVARGSWDQYDETKLSAGGMIIDRKAKSVTLTSEIRARFGIEAQTLTPADLIRTLLKSDVDLLWFGGIGTFVKSSHESHADVGDKANDSLRVDGHEIRARVIGEGANLGVTQAGRIEYAQAGASGAGGRLNTDFIDNSGGVDCSDHEVNIKILLGQVVQAGDLTIKQRNQLLERMTDEVGGLVLRDNYLQSQALSLSESEAAETLDQHVRLMRTLEKAGKLNRRIEGLPDDETLVDRAQARQGLTRPELAILLAYAKIVHYDELLASTLPDDPALSADLLAYFPDELDRSFTAAIETHPLKREIIATHVTNSMVNRVGPTFVAEMQDKSGMGAADVARAYVIVRDAYGLRDAWRRIEELDDKVPAAVQIRMMLATRRLVERATAWILRSHGQDLDIAKHTARLAPQIERLKRDLDRLIHEEARAVIAERIERLTADGVPEETAHFVASVNLLAAGPDIIRIAESEGEALETVAPIYFDLGRRLGIAWLRDGAARLPSATHWAKQAVGAIVDDLYALQADLAQRAVATPADGSGSKIEAWIDKRRHPVERIDQLMTELRALESLDIAMLAVASRRLRGLAAG